MNVRVSWLVAMLTATGTNAPKHFPKSPEDLLKKRETKAFNPQQWAATFSQILGKPVKIDRPVPG
ncbi:hypothetical protein NKJ09_22715 [Mesorhizobium sp. M0189]|uniref:hypothetical protein n=1 Tax=Mesorhizobium sp. M0189 TaxID=2956909 RepID=UPI003337D77A